MNKEQIFEKMFKNISYDTYKNIESASFIAPVVINTANVFIESALISWPLYVLTAASLYYFGSTTISFAEIYTKDIREIKEIYDELIKDYSFLIEDFEFKEPVEIFALYNYMLHKGYLSKTRYYMHEQPQYGDIFSLYGANIVTGSGLCRHDASFLADVFNKIDINSQILPVYLNDTEAQICEFKKFVSILEIELKTTTDPNRKIEIEELLKIYKNKLKTIKTKFEPFKKMNGNHVITLSEYNGKCYFFDATNEVIYKKNNIDSSYIVSNKTGRVKIAKGGYFNQKLDKEETNRKLILPETDIFDDKKLFNTTTKLCKENRDLLDIFKNQHISLYNEIDNKLSNIKYKKLIK